MRAVVIAIITENNKISKYRLLSIPDTNNYTANNKFEVIDVTEQQLIYVIKNKQLTIDNIEIREGKIVGRGARLDRYTKIDSSGKILGKAPLVILRQLVMNDSTAGYVVSDFKGKVVNGKIKDIIAYAKVNGIANGKLSTRNGKEFISSIQDSYGETVIREQGQSIQRGNQEVVKEEGQREIKPWTIEEFKKYMDSNDYSYLINDDELTYLDRRVKDYIIPDGIKWVYYKSSVDSNIKHATERIYIPSSVISTDTSILKYLKSLKQVIFDDNIKKIDLRNMGIIKYNIPKSIERIVTHNTNVSELFEIDYTGLDKLDRLYNCGVNSNISRLRLGSVRLIDLSFIDSNIGDKKIEITEKVEIIENSFIGLNIDEIDFSNAINLRKISSGSFSYLPNIKKLDLSKCKNLQKIGENAFNKLSLLEEVILPDCLDTIGEDCFKWCKNLKSITLPKKLRTILDNVFSEGGIEYISIPEGLNSFKVSNSEMTIELEDRETLDTRMLNGIRLKKVILPDSIERINYTAMYNGLYEIENIPKSLKFIDRWAFFNYSDGKKGGLDFGVCADLRYIGESAFEQSGISYLILPDGVTQIGDKVFKGASNLEWVYIPSSVTSIGRGCLQGVGESTALGITVYTEEGSSIEKYCKRNKIRVVNVENIEELYEIKKEQLEGLTEASEAKIRKLNFLIPSDSIHAQLLNKEYAPNASKLLNLYSKCTEEVEERSIKLDTKRFKSIEVSDIFTQNELVEINNKKEDTTKYSSVFNSHVNFITNVSTDMSVVLNKAGFERIRETGKLDIKVRVAYSNNMILEITKEIENNTFKIIVIIINDKAVYATVKNDMYKNVFIGYEYILPDKIIVPVEEAIEIGKAYDYGVLGMNSDMPDYMRNITRKALRSQLSVVGIDIKSKQTLGRGTSIYATYLISNASGKIIKAEAKVNEGKGTIGTVITISSLAIKEVTDITELDKNSLSVIRETYFNSSETDIIISKLVFSEEEYIEKLKLQGGAYDEPEASIEWEISKSLNDAGITKLEDLNKQALEVIFDTAFFYKTRRKLDTFKRGDLEETIRMKDCLIECFSYEKNRNAFNYKMISAESRYITVVTEYGTVNKETVQCYVSHDKISKVFSDLLDLASKPGESAYYIDNKPNSYFDYTYIGKVKAIEKYGKHYSISLGINKSTGIVYMLAWEYNPGVTKLEVYRILRYRSLGEALKYTEYFYSGSVEIRGKRYDDTVFSIVCTLEHIIEGEINNGLRSENQIETVRSLIIEGYPNNYALSGIKKYLFDSVAKQRKLT